MDQVFDMHNEQAQPIDHNYHCSEDGNCDDYALYGECSHSDTAKESDIINYGRPGVQVYYIHKFEVELRNGGPEEGGWHYTEGTPCDDWVPLRVVIVDGHLNDNDALFDMCRMFNGNEHKRREGLQYGFHSVLAYRETFYSYDISTKSIAEAYPKVRPHYE